MIGLAAALAIGILLTGCPTDGGGGDAPPPSVSYEGTASGGTTYTLQISGGTAEGPEKDDRYELRITSSGTAKTSSGTVESAVNGVLELQPDVPATPTFTVTISDGGIGGINGNITLDDGGSELAPTISPAVQVYFTNGSPYIGNGTASLDVKGTETIGTINAGKLSLPLSDPSSGLNDVSSFIKTGITLTDSSVKGVMPMEFVVKDDSGKFYQLSSSGNGKFYFYFYVDKPLAINGSHTSADRKEEWDLDLKKGWNRIQYSQVAGQPRLDKYENLDPAAVSKWTIEQSAGGDIRGTWKKGNITLTIEDDKLTITGSSIDGEYTIDNLSSNSCTFFTKRTDLYGINFKLENGQLVILEGGGPSELRGTWTKQN
jgi:hypothetical protein